MFIDTIKISNFRVFRKSEITFVHPEQPWAEIGLPKPALPNINLLLADNGLGKTTMLKAIALAALGPAVSDSGVFAYRLVRREPKSEVHEQPKESVLEATFTSHEQDEAAGVRFIESRVTVGRRVDLESLRWSHPDEKLWHPIFSSSSDAFFFVGYGATRRVERRAQVDMASRRSSSFVRAQRIQSLFEEAYSLIPLNAWLPAFKSEQPKRFTQVVELINSLSRSNLYSSKWVCNLRRQPEQDPMQAHAERGSSAAHPLGAQNLDLLRLGDGPIQVTPGSPRSHHKEGTSRSRRQRANIRFTRLLVA